MDEQEKLIEAAEDAITNVFNNKSVGQQQTTDDLIDLRGFIDTMIDTL